MGDFVIDTNVLKHASDKNFSKQQDCIDFIETFKASTHNLCMDVSNEGLIAYEYRKHIKAGMLGWVLLATLARQPGRIKFVPRDIDPAKNNKINQTGIKKPDRLFVRIAYNTNEKMLVTHDYEDFVDKIRRIFWRELGVRVLESRECLAYIV